MNSTTGSSFFSLWRSMRSADTATVRLGPGSEYVSTKTVRGISLPVLSSTAKLTVTTRPDGKLRAGGDAIMVTDTFVVAGRPQATGVYASWGPFGAGGAVEGAVNPELAEIYKDNSASLGLFPGAASYFLKFVHELEGTEGPDIDVAKANRILRRPELQAEVKSKFLKFVEAEKKAMVGDVIESGKRSDLRELAQRLLGREAAEALFTD